MEAQERNQNENASKSGDPGVVISMNPDVPVDPGTLSTADASLGVGAGALQDASVISAITDHASLEGNFVPSLLAEGANMPAPSDDPEVPKQVILDEERRPTPPPSTAEQQRIPPGISVSPPPPSTAQTLVVTAIAPDVQSTVSTSALPDPPKALGTERSISDNEQKQHPRSVSSEDVRSVMVTTPVSESRDNRETQDDPYILSPEVSNAIVERSPGGRYVRFMEKLGSGASKDVFRAYDTQEGIEVAWNVVTLGGVPRTERNRIINEVRLLERLHHQNIISFHGSWVNRERQEINFVTEILSSGTLKSFIKKVQVIRWKIAKRWAVQILNGLAYLHSQEPPVIHRDLKCENIFINGTSGDLRIGDLGLSTVHRNGKVLSVLGTPEFMAPDMYEETPYDEKVDIYSFGLCMLEIFTKEIPYSECKNPAQIYKKVSAGEPPEVLTRLESRHAREFVMLCLGYKDENGKFVRPSAAELLTHSFLDKRNSDDDEVIVERPLRERIIPEASESTGTSPNGMSKQYYSNGGSPHYSSSNPGQGTSMDTTGRSTDLREAESMNSARHARMQSTNSLEDDGNDHFDYMPESESNMKRVKVMIGRGQELLEDDTAPRSGGLSQGALQAAQAEAAPAPAYPPAGAHPNTGQSVPAPEVVPPPPENQHAAHNYLVAAAVIEDEAPHVRPYADDILKLVVTLPVEGQTQNVQFDFHLVRDDPVQVAKEMVQELRIPQGAVLEISETVSALACSARMKQDTYNARMQEQSAAQASVPASAPVSSEQGSHAVPENQYGRPNGQNPAQHAPGHGQQYAHPQPMHEHQQATGQGQLHGGHSQPPQQPQHYVQASNHPVPAPAHPVSAAQVVDEQSGNQSKPPQHSYSHPPIHGPTPPASTGVSPAAPHGEHHAVIGVAAAGGMTVPFAGYHGTDRTVSGEVQTDASPPASGQLGLSDEDDEDIQAEMRRLEEEYERSLERAKKVFDSRMVNLQRSQKEKEKEHLKTLEKHEKERAEFEKRRALEEEQQQRRLEQIQKERDRKLQTLALEKKKALMQMQNCGPDMNADAHAAAHEAANYDVENREWQGQNIGEWHGQNVGLSQSERSGTVWNQTNAQGLTQSERSSNSGWNQTNAAAAQPASTEQNQPHSMQNGMGTR
eukprot:scaffold2657_cov89-Amphora_coffeaeformis.AAC.9